MNVLLIILLISIPCIIVLLKLTNVIEFFNSISLYNKHVKLLNETDKIKAKNNLYDIPIYVINLKRSIDRKKFMEEQTKILDIKINFIEGVDGNNIQNLKNSSFMLDNNKINFINNISTLNKYELGCFLSHIKSLINAYFNNLDYVLVLEDDVSMSLVSKWNISIKDIIKNAPKDWDAISLYCINKRNDNKKYINTNFWGTPAILYNKNGIKKLLNKIYDMNTKTINIIEDNAIDYFLQHMIKMYMYNDYLFIPINDNNNLDSLIHTEHTNSHKSKSEKILNNYL
jgi:GR25 family glycosyltransferase involved in LPS biosynthesis